MAIRKNRNVIYDVANETITGKLKNVRITYKIPDFSDAKKALKKLGNKTTDTVELYQGKFRRWPVTMYICRLNLAYPLFVEANRVGRSFLEAFPNIDFSQKNLIMIIPYSFIDNNLGDIAEGFYKFNLYAEYAGTESYATRSAFDDWVSLFSGIVNKLRYGIQEITIAMALYSAKAAGLSRNTFSKVIMAHVDMLRARYLAADSDYQDDRTAMNHITQYTAYLRKIEKAVLDNWDIIPDRGSVVNESTTGGAIDTMRINSGSVTRKGDVFVPYENAVVATNNLGDNSEMLAGDVTCGDTRVQVIITSEECGVITFICGEGVITFKIPKCYVTADVDNPSKFYNLFLAQQYSLFQNINACENHNMIPHDLQHDDNQVDDSREDWVNSFVDACNATGTTTDEFEVYYSKYVEFVLCAFRKAHPDNEGKCGEIEAELMMVCKTVINRLNTPSEGIIIPQ